MHVGVFIGDFKPEAGGGYTFVNDATEAFFSVAGESAHRFTLFCYPDAAAHLKKRALPSNVEIAALKPRGKLGWAVAALKHLSPTFSICWRRPGALERAAKRKGVDIVWFVGGFFDTLDMPYIANVWDVQHLTHPWFPEVSTRGKWEYKEAFISRHLRRATRITTATQAGKTELMTFYRLQEHRVRILPYPTPAFALNNYEHDARPILKKFGLPEKYLFYPAQFWAHKNHVNLLLAMDILRKRGGEVPHLALSGSDKGNKAHVLKAAAQLGLSDYVHALGFVSVEELVTLYQNAQAMVYASFSGPGNLPPLEALALRCPLATAECPGASEQLGNTAVYFDPHKPEAIADAIMNVLSDSAGTTQRVKRGLARAQQWTGQHYVRALFTILDEFETERRCWPA
jgi:glycosyltransferase involved in cell wall biosynthesis